MKLFRSTSTKVCLEMQEINNNRTTDIPYGGMLTNQSPEPAQAWFENDKKEKKSLLHSTLFETPSGVRSRFTQTCWRFVTKIFQQMSYYAKLPYVTIGSIIILVIVYIVLPEHAHALLEWPPGPRWREPWRMITYGFVHNTFSHVIGNAVGTLAVGWRLEIDQGPWRVLVLMISGVICGALGASIFQPTVHVVGESAAIFALYTSDISNIILMFNSIPCCCWCDRLIIAIGLIIIEVLYKREILKENHPVAWSAHLTGAVVGLPLGFLIFKETEDNIHKLRNRLFRIMSAVALLVALVGVIVYHKFYADPTTIYTSKI